MTLINSSQDEEEVDMEFRNLKEFHRCKALEDVDEQAFDRIVENMAKVHIVVILITISTRKLLIRS